jgi:hypothetical protein
MRTIWVEVLVEHKPTGIRGVHYVEQEAHWVHPVIRAKDEEQERLGEDYRVLSGSLWLLPRHLK